jgi:hypothetical protein
MHERFLVRPAEITPGGKGPLLSAKLNKLQPIFERGQEAVEALDPVSFIIAGQISVRRPDQLLIVDGNHRLTLGFVHSLLVPAAVYTYGDVIEMCGDEYPVTSEMFALARQKQAQAKELGYTNFEVLAREAGLI